MPIDPNVPVIWDSPATGGGTVSPQAMPSPVFSRPQQAPLPTPARVTEMPGFEGAVAAEVEKARLRAKAEQEAQEKQQNRELVGSSLNAMRRLYTNLKDMGGMVTEEQGALANMQDWVINRAGMSLPGNPTGSKQVSLVQSIMNVRPKLVRAGSGLTGREMDAAREIEQLLNTLGNPSQSFETVNMTLDAMEEVLATPPGKTVKLPDGTEVAGLKDAVSRGDILLKRQDTVTDKEELRDTIIKTGTPTNVDDLVKKYLK